MKQFLKESLFITIIALFATGFGQLCAYYFNENFDYNLYYLIPIVCIIMLAIAKFILTPLGDKFKIF